jgi:hypothetical protein
MFRVRSFSAIVSTALAVLSTVAMALAGSAMSSWG